MKHVASGSLEEAQEEGFPRKPRPATLSDRASQRGGENPGTRIPLLFQAPPTCLGALLSGTGVCWSARHTRSQRGSEFSQGQLVHYLLIYTALVLYI